MTTYQTIKDLFPSENEYSIGFKLERKTSKLYYMEIQNEKIKEIKKIENVYEIALIEGLTGKSHEVINELIMKCVNMSIMLTKTRMNTRKFSDITGIPKKYVDAHKNNIVALIENLRVKQIKKIERSVMNWTIQKELDLKALSEVARK